jgi:hypothetical protein
VSRKGAARDELDVDLRRVRAQNAGDVTACGLKKIGGRRRPGGVGRSDGERQEEKE